MAPARTSADSSESEDKGSAPLASSLAGLPVRGDADKSQNQNGQADPSKPKSGQLKDFLDLATTNKSDGSPDVSARLEAKRLEFEKQKALQKKAFEEQMKQLEMQQEKEERELLEKGGDGPARSQSGNDLTKAEEQKKTDAANARSMPGSRRHSNAGTEEKEKDGKRKPGEPMLNSFLFDDELDADLQNSAWGGKYLQMNTDDDKFPILVRRDSVPGALSASSAALDLAAQAPNGGSKAFARGSSEWPRFPAGRPDSAAHDASADRARSATHGGDAGVNGEHASPRAAGSGRTSALPPPGRNAGGQSDSPAPSSVDKKLGDLGGLPKSAQPLGGLNGQPSYIDSMADQFSQFSIDGGAFRQDPSSASPFASYGEQGAFSSYGGDGFPSIGKSRLYGVNPPVQPSETNRFAGLRLEDLQGDMLPLCKDQFGCRYLQKKLEDGNPEHRDMIFNEVFPHFAELMTDPFANYLTQRLLEYCTDEQRDALIESISGELVSISLNMHGTRAVQKMIDFLSTQKQVQSLILALNLNVVTLIKDLNGNHVIQKCLNHLPPEDNQFIYNAVAAHCIEVATHRHGCCVLQRCIDHASESQRIQLVTEITYNSLTLVQDAFGNYVVQYVLDLNDNRFIEAIVRQFLGNVAALSAQKFSSNVVEKCIRVADAAGRRAIIDELLNKQRLERLLRDSFANYVVQTALDYAEPAQRAQLIETIRPILPMIRNTPYGKRIQSKIQRETNDHHHMGRHHYPYHGGYPYGMGMHGPPHGYMQHPGHMGHPGHPMDFGRGGPYMGYAPPPPHMGGPPHMQQHMPPHPHALAQQHAAAAAAAAAASQQQQAGGPPTPSQTGGTPGPQQAPGSQASPSNGNMATPPPPPHHFAPFPMQGMPPMQDFGAPNGGQAYAPFM